MSSLRVTDRSFRYVSPCLCNQLIPASVGQPHPNLSISDSPLPIHLSHRLLCWYTALIIHNSLSLSLVFIQIPIPFPLVSPIPFHSYSRSTTANTNTYVPTKRKNNMVTINK